MSKIGFTYSTFRQEICPTEPAILVDLSTPIYTLLGGWILELPAMTSEPGIIQISDKYILSNNVHLADGVVLISQTNEISFETAFEVSKVLSFLFDSITDISYPYIPGNEREFREYFKGMRQVLEIKGQKKYPNYRYIDAYLGQRKGFLHAFQSFAGDHFMRTLPLGESPKGGIVSFTLPKDKKLQKALEVYRQALFSIELSSQIVNYWRVLEAVSKPKQRKDLLKNVFEKKLVPVMCKTESTSTRKFDLIQKYKNFLNPYFKKLLVKNGNSYDEIIKYLFKKRRCASAHANENILEATSFSPLAQLFKDTLLLKLISRTAIQMYWEKSEDNL